MTRYNKLSIIQHKRNKHFWLPGSMHVFQSITGMKGV